MHTNSMPAFAASAFFTAMSSAFGVMSTPVSAEHLDSFSRSISIVPLPQNGSSTRALVLRLDEARRSIAAAVAGYIDAGSEPTR